MTNNAMFVRETAEIEDICRGAKNKLMESLHCGDLLDWEKTLTEVIPAPILHNTMTDFEFYNRLVDAMMASVQVPSERNIMINCALAYCAEISFFGCGPKFPQRPLLGDRYELEDVEPVFTIICQDEEKKLCPDPVAALRFSVSHLGAINWYILDVSWLYPAESILAPSAEIVAGAGKSTSVGGLTKPKAATKVKVMASGVPNKSNKKKKPKKPACSK